MKKCPRCGLKLSGNHTEKKCPKCHLNLSFSSRESADKRIDERFEEVSDEVNKIKGGIIIGVVVAVLLAIICFTFPEVLVTPFVGDNGSASIDGVYTQLRTLPIAFLVISAIVLAVAIILFVVKNKTQKGFTILNAALATLGVLGIIASITVNTFFNSVFRTDIGAEYRKEEYIEIGTEKIPSIYKVLGREDLLLADVQSEIENEELGIVMDYVAIIYEKDFSEDELAKYREELISSGYTLKNMTYGEKSASMLLKNGKDDGLFYVVRIDDKTVTYADGAGEYEDILGKYMKDEDGEV